MHRFSEVWSKQRLNKSNISEPPNAFHNVLIQMFPCLRYEGVSKSFQRESMMLTFVIDHWYFLLFSLLWFQCFCHSWKHWWDFLKSLVGWLLIVLEFQDHPGNDILITDFILENKHKSRRAQSDKWGWETTAVFLLANKCLCLCSSMISQGTDFVEVHHKFKSFLRILFTTGLTWWCSPKWYFISLHWQFCWILHIFICVTHGMMTRPECSWP